MSEAKALTNVQIETLESCCICHKKDIKIVDVQCCIWKCEACDFYFNNPRPSQEEITRFYSKTAKYDSWLLKENERDLLWKRRLKKMQKTIKEGSILDIGTGIGQFLYHAKKYYKEIYGTEVSESAIAIAKNKYNLNLIKGTIEEIKLQEMKFDNIVLFHVLEHVPDPKILIVKCKNLLEENGILTIAVPNEILSLKNRLLRLLDFVGIKKFKRFVGKLGLSKIVLDGSLEEIHLSYFTPFSLRKLLEKNDFKVIEDSLDPYYAASNVEKAVHDVYYFLCLFLLKLFRVNIYNTIWIVAKKKNNMP